MRVIEGRPNSQEDLAEITVYDADADVTVTFNGYELTNFEWDGVSGDEDFRAADWYMIEIAGADQAYFVNQEDLSESARKALFTVGESMISSGLYGEDYFSSRDQEDQE